MSPMEETTIREAIEIHKRMVTQFEGAGVEIVAKIVETIVGALSAGGTLYLCGNGGSAADAQHIAGEFVGRFRVDRRALPAVALSTDTSVMTCIGNDYDYSQVFARQVDALMDESDILWAFSTSGTSANVVAAAETAKEKNARIIAFTGRKDTPLEALADVCLCAEADLTARSQEIHQLAYHLVCDLVERRLTK